MKKSLLTLMTARWYDSQGQRHLIELGVIGNWRAACRKSNKTKEFGGNAYIKKNRSIEEIEKTVENDVKFSILDSSLRSDGGE